MRRGLFYFAILGSLACHSALPTGLHTKASDTSGARDSLTKAMQSMLAAKSYRARVESTTSSGTTSKTIIEFVAPDHFHVTREANPSGHAPIKQETIVVGDETWVKMGESPWQTFPVNLGDTIKQFRNPKVVDDIAKSIDVKVIGTDLVDGSQTTIYQYTLGDPEKKDFNTTAKTWVSAGDGLPRKTESEADFNFGGRPIHTKSTVTYYDYEADIKIDKPL